MPLFKKHGGKRKKQGESPIIMGGGDGIHENSA